MTEDAVFERVPNVAWSEQGLQGIDLRVMEHIDGVTPVALLASVLDVTVETLSRVLSALLGRGLVAIIDDEDGPPGSGMQAPVLAFRRAAPCAWRLVG